MNDAERDVWAVLCAEMQDRLNELRELVECKKRTIADERWEADATGLVRDAHGTPVGQYHWSLEIALLPELVRAVRDGNECQMDIILSKMGVE